MRVGLIGNHQGLARALSEAGIEFAFHPAGAPGEVGIGRGNVRVAADFAELCGALEDPRLVLLDLPLGAEIDRTIDTAYVAMEPGDAVIDPSGSYWGDTLQRYRRMRHRSLFYVDVALLGPAPGATVLAAGDERGVDLALPLLERLAAPKTVVRAGGAGAAHHALMVRDAIAGSLAQALSEAQQILEAFPNEPAASDSILRELWPASPQPAGPRAAWLLEDAVQLQAAVPHLAQAVMLELGHALDEHRATAPAPRVGGFVHPDEIL